MTNLFDKLEGYENLTPSKIRTSSDLPSLKQVAEEYKKVGEYGIKYLDEKLNGICQGDMVLLGAATGCGKSTIADMIARHNANKGLNVYHISLENQPDKNYIRQAFYAYRRMTKDTTIPNQRVFSECIRNNKISKDVIKTIEEQTKKDYAGINMIYKEGANYTYAQLVRDIHEVFQRDADLIIVDHIDYLDRETGENDIDHITKTMSFVWDMEILTRVPIILLSHLRKTTSGSIPLIPRMDDFIGSSNKTKVSPIVIVLSPDTEDGTERSSQLKYNEKPTFCCVRKFRDGYTDKTKTGWICFNSDTGSYNPNYEEFTLIKDLTVVKDKPISDTTEQRYTEQWFNK